MLRKVVRLFDISIHAPREGGDTPSTINFTFHLPISIHAPREGGDRQVHLLDGRQRWLFQSTPPARGATRRQPMAKKIFLFQSTPPARGATYRVYVPRQFR